MVYVDVQEEIIKFNEELKLFLNDLKNKIDELDGFFLRRLEFAKTTEELEEVKYKITYDSEARRKVFKRLNESMPKCITQTQEFTDKMIVTRDLLIEARKKEENEYKE